MENIADWHNSLHQNLHSVLSFFENAWPHIVPPLLVIAVEAPLSLRTWLAVQDTPQPDVLAACNMQSKQNRIEKSFGSEALSSILESFRRYSLTHIAPTYLLIVAILGTYLQCALDMPSRQMAVFDSLTIAPLLIYSTTRFLRLILHTPYAVHYLDPYIVSKRRPNVRLPLACTPALASLFISYRAVFKDDNICTAIVHATLLHALVSSDVASTKSFRSMVLYSVTNVATILALVVLFFTPFSPGYLSVSLLSQASNFGVYDDGVNIVGPDVNVAATRWPLFALTVLWNIFPTELAALCFRFDYGLAQQRAPAIPATSAQPYMYVDADDDAVGPIFLGGDETEPFLHHGMQPGSPSLDLSFDPASASEAAAYTLQRPSTRLAARHPRFGPKRFYHYALLALSLSSLSLLFLASLSAPSHFPSSPYASAAAHVVQYVGPLLPLVTMPFAVL
ncbi:hypothetical protein EW145_g5789, partial [Phellinidium pouzarii]